MYEIQRHVFTKLSFCYLHKCKLLLKLVLVSTILIQLANYKLFLRYLFMRRMRRIPSLVSAQQ